MPVTKADIISAFMDVKDCTRRDATDAYNLVFGTDGIIATGLANGEEVRLAGFGVFRLKARKARVGRNPQTGKSMKIKASKTASFRPAKALKDAIS